MNDVKKSNTTFKLSSRLLALFLTLAMIVGVVPAVAMAESDGGLKGGIQFTPLDSEDTINDTDIGDVFEINNVFNTMGVNAGDPYTARVYLNMDGVSNEDIFKYIQLTALTPEVWGTNDTSYTSSYSGNGHNFSLGWDPVNGWYVKITNISRSSTETIDFNAKFLPGKSVDGQSLTVTIREEVNGSVENSPIQHLTYPNPNTIVANAEPSLTTSKSLENQSQESISYEQLNNLTQTIDYNLTVTPGNAGQTVGNADTKINSYTVTDTVYLPQGMYVSTIEEAKAAFTFKDSSGNAISWDDLTIAWTPISDNGTNGKYTSFTVSYTVNSAAGNTQPPKASYKASLDLSKIGKDSTFETGQISNGIKTDYSYNKWVVNNNSGSTQTVTKTATAPDVQTNITKSGNGIKDPSKKFTNDNTWSSWPERKADLTGVYGYVIQGERLQYVISVTNDSSETKHYTVVDNLNKWGLGAGYNSDWGGQITGTGLTNLKVYMANLTDDAKNNKTTVIDERTKTEVPLTNQWNNIYGSLNGSESTGDVIIFEFDLAGNNTTGTVTFNTTVDETPSIVNGMIVNEAQITAEGLSGSSTGTVSAPPVEEKYGTANVSITKGAQKNGSTITGYDANDVFDYVITVTNNGSAGATNVNFSDYLPSGLVAEGTSFTLTKSGAGVTQTQSYTFSSDPQGAVISNETLAKGETWAITIPVRTVSENLPDKIKNDAFVSYTTTDLDGNPITQSKDASNTLVNKTIKESDLSINKTTTAQSVMAGGEIEYTVTVTNNNAYYPYTDQITVTDIPQTQGLTVKSITVDPSVGSVSGNVVTIDQDLAANGGTATFTVTAEVSSDFTPTDGTAAVVNRAKISDDIYKDATTPVVGKEGEGTFSVTKTAKAGNVTLNDGDGVASGTDVTFTITATNNSTETINEYCLQDVMSGYKNGSGNNIIKSLTIKKNDQVVELIGQQIILEQLAGPNGLDIYFQRQGYDNCYGGYGSLNVIRNYNTLDLALAQGDSIVVEYTMTTGADGAEWIVGTNKVTAKVRGANYSYIETDSDEITLNSPAPTATPTPTPTPDPNATPMPTPNPTPVTGPNIVVEKTATYEDIDGNDQPVIEGVSEVPAGNYMTFKVRVTNTGTEDLENWELFDVFDGISVPANQTVSMTMRNSDGVMKAQAEGITTELQNISMINQYSYSYDHDNDGQDETYNAAIHIGAMKFNYNYFNSYSLGQGSDNFIYGGGNGVDFTLKANGGYIDFYFTVKTTKAWTTESGINVARLSYQGSEDKDNDGFRDMVVAEDDVTYKRGAPSAVSDAILKIDKDANIVDNTNAATDFAPVNKTTTKIIQQSNGDLKIDYRVVLENTSTTEAYETASASFTDVLPNGAKLFVPGGTYNRIISVVRGGESGANWGSWDGYYGKTGDATCSYTVNSGYDIEVTASKTVNETNAQTGETTSSTPTTDIPTNAETQNARTEDQIDCDKLVISFPHGLNIPANANGAQNCIYILYSLIIPASEVQSFFANATTAGNDDFGKNIEEQNEITFKGNTKFKNSEGKATDQVAASETVDLIPPIIHPGITKEYVGCFDPEESSVHKDISPSVSSYLLWKATIYNGFDSNGIAMSDYVLKDVVPNGYEYLDSAHEAVARETGGYVFKNSVSSGNCLDSSPKTLTGSDAVMDFTGSQYTLNPGEKLVVYIVTKPGAEGVSDGLYTNVAKVLTQNTEFVKDNVCIGAFEKFNGTEYTNRPAVAASASVAIRKVKTEGVKTVTYGTTTASGSSVDNNIVKASLGGRVQYNLTMTNESNGIISDVTLIDRLPYENDPAVLGETGRGSSFAIGIDPKTINAKIILDEGTQIDINNYIEVTYASDLTTEDAGQSRVYFDEADADWSIDITNKGGRVSWTPNYSASANLVRFCLKKDLSALNNQALVAKYTTESGETVYGLPQNAKIQITFDGLVPDSVQEMGRTNVAWNSFGYYYNSEQYQDMISEASRVGVYVDEEQTGGRILVRKIYKSSITTTPVTFYFSCFKGPYDPNASWPVNEQRLKGVKPLTMTGNKNGAQAELYFTNLDIDPDGNNITYYIYESDRTGKPLEAGTVYVAGKDSKGNPTTVGSAAESTIEKDGQGNITGVTEPAVADANQIYFKKATVGGDVTVPFVMDNGNKPDDKQNQQKQASNQRMENSKYFVWNKDLSVNKKENSAIFNNFYYPDAEVKVFGPLYADVPMDKTEENAKDYMTSTRPNTFENFSAETGRLDSQLATKSIERDTKKYDERIDGYGGDGVHYHTIATGFIAKVTGTDTYGIQNVKWTVTSTPASNPNINTVPVLVRLRTDIVGSGSSSEVNEATVIYLDDFMVMNDAPTAEERRSEFNGDIAAMDGEAEAASASDEIGFDGEDAIETIDDIYLSNYSIEERAAFIAESLSIDPANIQWDDFGTPYVIMDEQLESQALYVSGSAELNDLKDAPSKIESLNGSQSETNSGNMKGIKAYTEFGDYEKNKAGDSYAIYQLDPAAGKTYSWTINDDLPMTTLSEGSEVYLGLIIDQLYDQYAHAEVKLEADPPKADAVNVGSVVAPKANGTGNSDGEKGHLRYTDVDTPYFTSKFVKTKILSKLTAGSHYFIKFDPTNWTGVTDVDGSALSDDTNAMLIANKAVSLTDNKAITINGNAFTGHTYLSGAGSSSSCSAMINANPGDKLNVYALSSSTEATRTLRIIYIDTNGKEKKVDFTDDVKKAVDSGTTETNITPVTWTVPDGAKGPVYICSKSSGMYLYAIDVNPSN